MEKLNHRDRLMTVLAGEKPDRFAVSFWRHFFDMEHHASGLMEAMVAFQKKFDWDFMKINPRADYHSEPWGLKLHFSYDSFEKHKKSNFPIRGIEDWEKIKPQPLDSPALAEHLYAVSLIRRAVGPELPLLMTVFSPLSVAGRLLENRNDLIEHLRQEPELIESALEAITVTFVRFAEELRNAGADGLFFATTHWASRTMITWEEYRRFGTPFDLRVIEAAGEDAINLLHVCDPENYLKELAEIDYHSRMYNWDADHPTNLPLDRAYDLLKGKAIVGGGDYTGWLLCARPDEAAAKIRSIMAAHDPSRLIIGPGCAVLPATPMENLRAVREAI
ncbi:MAG TPA: uroporphyrinogen decarboxylase family protein [candidate division Zixibacteria bacterium]|nr:uroporphyrinogen decarboxylase family protein [candidate division Zixibacteria bacterium]